MADCDAVDFLKTWNLEQYIEVFRDMKTILFFTETMMMELIPSVGHRAQLKSNIDQWKNIIYQIPSPSINCNLKIVSLEKNSCSLLRTLVGELNEFKKYLKPKFHFMLHYPALINTFGPISHLWSMRFEAKHRTSKIAARSTFNRLFVGPCKILNSIKRLEVQTFLNLNSVVSLTLVKWAKVKGTHYKINAIVTKDILEDNYPIFASIINIFLYGTDRIIFEVNIFSTICFNEHVFCYEVHIPNIKNNISTCYIFQDLFISPVPNSLNIASNGKQYVTKALYEVIMGTPYSSMCCLRLTKYVEHTKNCFVWERTEKAIVIKIIRNKPFIKYNIDADDSEFAPACVFTHIITKNNQIHLRTMN
ncbi:hypothetical protein AGLY_003143 [Aphis glycines]|uniref:Uncharacterized protein n=1 Tax=Aphis glycines TaxID=307491 RepID=A0A6G0U4M3_APHGL|nr:hypothetical protein AGLY_003143 [Aphis glycines]